MYPSQTKRNETKVWFSGFYAIHPPLKIVDRARTVSAVAELLAFFLSCIMVAFVNFLINEK